MKTKAYRTLYTSVLTASVFGLSLVACSGGSGGGDEGADGILSSDSGASGDGISSSDGSASGSGGPGSGAVSETAFSSIAGVWDATTDEGQLGIDEFYIVIGADGNGSEYDYLGDTLDNQEDCYSKEDFQLTSLGDNVYQYEYADGFSEMTTLTVIGGVLREEVDGDVISYPRAGIAEADFRPICP